MTEILLDTETVTIEVSSRGKRLRSPITVDVPIATRPGEKALNARARYGRPRTGSYPCSSSY